MLTVLVANPADLIAAVASRSTAQPEVWQLATIDLVPELQSSGTAE
jgi:hypothetical protein